MKLSTATRNPGAVTRRSFLGTSLRSSAAIPMAAMAGRSLGRAIAPDDLADAASAFGEAVDRAVRLRADWYALSGDDAERFRIHHWEPCCDVMDRAEGRLLEAMR